MEADIKKFTPIDLATLEMTPDMVIGVKIMGWQIANLYEHEPEVLDLCTHTYLEKGELGARFVSEFKPTKKMSHAWMVVERMEEFCTGIHPTSAWLFRRWWSNHSLCMYSESEASKLICEAALKAVEDCGDANPPPWHQPIKDIS